jgi:protein-disulfide isomerase
VIVEFSDFACPYCKASHEAVREMGLKYKNDIKIIYRDFLGHNNSLDLALAGRCAGEQNKFWAMHDKLFLNQDDISLSSLPILAQQIGVSTSTFNNCLKSQKYLAHIQADMAAAEKMKVTATPTWIINGYLVKGTLDRDGLDSIIKEILNIK